MENVPKTSKALAIQILKGNGLVNIILQPYEPNEVCYTINDNAFSILLERLNNLATLGAGHEFMRFSLYENTIPFAEEEEEANA